MKVRSLDAPCAVPDEFLDLPHRLYAGDPFWIPEEREQVTAAFAATNRWFARGRSALFWIPGRSRLACFRTDGLTVEGRPAAFFGYFECTDDEDAAASLLREAREWAGAQGASALFGPVNFDTLGNYRLRTSAEPDAITFPGEPYNQPAYPSLLEQHGFGVVRRYVTQISTTTLAPDPRHAAALAHARAAGYRFDALDGARWLELLPELHRAADVIFGDAFAYTPAPYDEFAAGYGAAVARRLCPRTSLLVRTVAGDLAGFLLCYPQYGPLAMQGSRLGFVPASRLTFAEHDPVLVAAGERTAIAKTIGVLPEHRRAGLMSAMGVEAVARGAGRYDRWIGALVRSDNPSRRWGEAHAVVERTYALYGASLDGTALSGGVNGSR